MRYIKMVIIVLFISLQSIMVNAANMEKATALLQESDLSRGNVSGIIWDIDIETETNGKTQKNSLQVLVKGTNSLAVYQSPSKVKGRKLLMKDRNMWFIKPGLSKPVPISPRQKLLGGASNGDIASTNYAGDYTIESFTKDLFQNEPCFVYELKAKNKKVTYDKIKYWVSEKRRIGLKAQFFTRSGKMFKTAFLEYDHTILINGEERPFVSKMTILNAMVKTDKTIMAYHNINIREISPSSFNLNLLVR
ncbi:MAG: outer membrane lipoprotein-sorting protein [Desulfobacula sp.]|jgi:hypothetical protein|nr:outer membrane lipoprotein-sorting protein [Desulfobacula sp.]MBT7262274.1 outer membrane lipoprotein-sorting protein [Desulfobacula sp.]